MVPVISQTYVEARPKVCTGGLGITGTCKSAAPSNKHSWVIKDSMAKTSHLEGVGVAGVPLWSCHALVEAEDASPGRVILSRVGLL